MCERVQASSLPCAGSGGSLHAHTTEVRGQVRPIPMPAHQMLLVWAGIHCRSLRDHPYCSEHDHSPHWQADGCLCMDSTVARAGWHSAGPQAFLEWSGESSASFCLDCCSYWSTWLHDLCIPLLAALSLGTPPALQNWSTNLQSPWLLLPSVPRGEQSPHPAAESHTSCKGVCQGVHG